MTVAPTDTSLAPAQAVARLIESIESVPPTPLRRIRGLALGGAACMAVFVGGFGGWSAYAPLESAAIASGIVEAEGGRKTIQHPEGGTVGTILVHDGDRVTAGQPLIRLDDTKPRTALSALQGQLWDALAWEARLVAERDGQPTIDWPASLGERASDPVVAQAIAGQQKIFETRRTLQQSRRDLIRQRIAQVQEETVGLRAQESAARKRILLVNEEIAGLRPLADNGLERPRLRALERDLAEIEGKRGETITLIARTQQAIAESEVNLLALQSDAQNDVAEQLRDARKKILELTEQMQAARDLLARAEIRAPEGGIVADLRIHVPGIVIAAGEPLLELVPTEDRLVVTAQVKPEDIHLVRASLPAQIRLMPFKHGRTSLIDGTVASVSADRLVDKKTGQSYFAAKIRFEEATLARVPEAELLPGMPSEVMIKTGETTVALYALSPILDSFHRAFRDKSH